MTKEEYLASLKKHLAGIPASDREEILSDYEEHFRVGMENGKTEEEIARSLGDVKTIARQFVADVTLQRAEENASVGNILRAVFASIALGFFNLVFVLGPFLGLVGTLFGLFAAAIGITVGALAGLIGITVAPIFPTFINVGADPLFASFLLVGLAAFGILFFILDCYLAVFFYKATVLYLRWNLQIIRK